LPCVSLPVPRLKKPIIFPFLSVLGAYKNLLNSKIQAGDRGVVKLRKKGIGLSGGDFVRNLYGILSELGVCLNQDFQD
jgi:hypothetical protein